MVAINNFSALLYNTLRIQIICEFFKLHLISPIVAQRHVSRPLTGIIVAVDKAALEVDRVNRVCSTVILHRHLEEKDLIGTVHVARDRVIPRIEHVAITQESTREATENQDLFSVLLADTTSLALR